MSFIIIFSLILIAAALFVSYAYFIEPGIIRVINSRIRTGKLKGRYKFLHISDLHLYKKMRKQNLEKIKEKLKLWTDWEKFDFIFITGDIIDNNSGIELIREVIGGLKSRLGIYAVMGNHDYFVYNFLHLFSPFFDFNDRKQTDQRALKKALSGAGVRLLIDQAEKIRADGNDLLITGIDSLSIKNKKFPGMNLTGENEFNIVLSHYPDAIKYYKGRADIMLSGHTHGGQITFFGHPILIRSSIGKKDSKGISAHGNTALYVSKGLGVSRNFPFRFFARPDLNIVEIIGENNGKI